MSIGVQESNMINLIGDNERTQGDNNRPREIYLETTIDHKEVIIVYEI
jgi:hypothetical protein